MTEKKTAEKILRQSKTAAEILRLKYADDKWEPIFSNIVAAMEEYAAQQFKMPTIGEIKKAALTLKLSSCDWEVDAIAERRGFIKGAEWLRNQIG